MESSHEIGKLPTNSFKPGDKGVIVMAEDGYWDSAIPQQSGPRIRWRMTNSSTRENMRRAKARFENRMELWSKLADGDLIRLTRQNKGWTAEFDGTVGTGLDPATAISNLAKIILKATEVAP